VIETKIYWYTSVALHNQYHNWYTRTKKNVKLQSVCWMRLLGAKPRIFLNKRGLRTRSRAWVRSRHGTKNIPKFSIKLMTSPNAWWQDKESVAGCTV
jgi:hypothetical protein